MDALLTIEAVAGILGLTPRRVHGLVRERKLACVQISPRDRRFLPEQLEAYIRSRILEPPKPVDRPRAGRVAFPPRGGDKSKLSGDSVRAQLLEEMRSW
jgi:hypothetical protein